MKTKFSILIFLFFTILVKGQQKTVHNFKYVIVPEKFDFVKSADQYQTSSLTKFLLEKNGFTVFLSNKNLPKDLFLNRCLALKANVIDQSNMFMVKSKIELRDCTDAIIYATEIGRSKEKDYKRAYQEAIRNAHKYMANIKYVYKPLINNSLSSIQTPNKAIESNSMGKTSSSKDTKAIGFLYAQKTSKGYQLVDNKQAIVFTILNTSTNNVFILQDKNGVLFKTDKYWFAEFYTNGNLVTQTFKIRF